MARRYPLCASRLVRLFKTAAFACFRSGRRRTDLVVVRLVRGCDLRFMIDGLLAPIKSSKLPTVFKFRVARHAEVTAIDSHRARPEAVTAVASSCLRTSSTALRISARRCSVSDHDDNGAA